MELSQKITRCTYSPMRKFHPYAVEAEKAGKKIYHLNIGQPDIKTPALFYKALERFRQPPVLSYAPSPGLPVLVQAIQDYYKKLDVDFTPEDILITTGGSEALQILMLCILDEGSEVLIPEPFYPNYRTMVQAAGGTVRPIPAGPQYHLCDRALLEAQITSNTRAILVSNPGNPTGVVLRPEEMRLLADVAKARGLYLIGDEVYREFVYGGTPRTSFAQLSDVAENVILIDSVSKRFSACGARVGALLSKNQPLMKEAMKLCQARLSVATLDQIGAAALYGCTLEEMEWMKEKYRKRRDLCYSLLQEIPGVECSQPEGAFYVMVTLPVDDTERFQKWLLEAFDDHGETVMFAPGSGFYATPGQGGREVRIAYVLQEQDLIRAMELLALALKAYNRNI